MTRTLYLHIGAHRTATSAIQRFLHLNVPRLASHGYLQVNGNGRQVIMMRELANGKRNAHQVAQDISTQCENAPHEIHSAILSDEDICCQKNLSYLTPFKEHFDVKVIFTLRRQDLWLESWYFQNIKWQWQKKLSHLTFPEFMKCQRDFHWIDYDGYIRHLEKLFGADNIRLTVHEKAHMPGGPIATFCRHLGIQDIADFENPGNVNPSFSPVMSEFMRQLPLDESPDPYRAELERIFHEIDRASIPSSSNKSSLLLSHAERQRVLSGFEAGNQAVAQRYFSRSALFEEPLPPQDAPLADMRLPPDSQTLMDQFVRPMMTGIIAAQKNRMAQMPNKPKA